MCEFFCRKCGIELGLIPENMPDPKDLLRNEYGRNKFDKHTKLTDSAGILSIFNDSSEAKYLENIINTSASGCIEIDDHGRTNLIIVESESTGCTLVHGTFYRYDFAIRLACPLDEEKMHVFPTSGSIIPRFCQKCGGPIFS